MATQFDNSRFVIVVTTISEGTFLDAYAAKIKEEGFQDETTIVIIPDLKTPTALYGKAQKLVKQKGIRAICPTIAEQDAYLKRLGKISKLIPYNSDNRRNIGYLMAYEGGAELLISVDDDNYPIPGTPFLKAHSVLLNPVDGEVLEADSGWFNVCRLLALENDNVYARGFPYFQRFKRNKVTRAGKKGVHVDVNAGLWLKDPELDAITWLGNPTKSVSFGGRSCILGRDTWTPVNTQNTAVARKVIPSWYFLKMGYALGGLLIDRYGDIFSGYFSQKCAKHLGRLVRVGTPIVSHRRNSHNYMRDLTAELGCILVLEDMLPWLVDVKLGGSTYSDAYLSLADQLESQTDRFKGQIWTAATRKYFHHIAECMRVWVGTLQTFDK